MFSRGFCEVSKNTFFTEILWATASVINLCNFISPKIFFNFLSANPTKLPNTLKQFVAKL